MPKESFHNEGGSDLRDDPSAREKLYADREIPEETWGKAIDEKSLSPKQKVLLDFLKKNEGNAFNAAEISEALGTKIRETIANLIRVRRVTGVNWVPPKGHEPAKLKYINPEKDKQK